MRPRQADYNPLLDVARSTYKENLEDIIKLSADVAGEMSDAAIPLIFSSGCSDPPRDLVATYALPLKLKHNANGYLVRSLAWEKEQSTNDAVPPPYRDSSSSVQKKLAVIVSINDGRDPCMPPQADELDLFPAAVPVLVTGFVNVTRSKSGKVYTMSTLALVRASANFDNLQTANPCFVCRSTEKAEPALGRLAQRGAPTQQSCSLRALPRHHGEHCGSVQGRSTNG